MQIINIQTDINKQDDVFTVGKLIDYSNIKSTVTNFLAASVTEKGDVAKNSVFKVCAALNSLHIYRNHGALLIVVTKHKKIVTLFLWVTLFITASCSPPVKLWLHTKIEQN